MTNYCIVLPYLQGGTELAKKFAEENCGHTKDHDEFYKLAGISREQVWIQRSSPGSDAPNLGIISIETDEISRILKFGENVEDILDFTIGHIRLEYATSVS